MNRSYAILFAVGWVVFWIYWFIYAVGTVGAKGSVYKNSGHLRWARVALLVIVILLIHLSSPRGSGFSYSTFAIHDGLVRAIGAVLFVAGLALAVWARIYLGKNWGMPMWQKDKPELITTGPYNYVRHPIYSGVLMAALGTALTISLYWLFALLISGTYFMFSATQEEKYMARQFPKDYPEYKKRTKMLVPFVL